MPILFVHQSKKYKEDWMSCPHSHNFLNPSLSGLPDEILVSVVSLLGIREAARTFVLSKRWKHLWSFNRVLNFDALQTIFVLELNPKELLEVERSKWIEFAIAKCVQRLEVDFQPCNLLEEAAVNLKVIGSSLRLKFLEISFCPNLLGLEVCATSLVSFKYFGLSQSVNMQIKDAFQLAELSISNHIDPIDSAFFPFSSYFWQLETLSLGLHLTHWKRGNRGFKQLPEFTKLKHLTLEVIADESTSILGWTTLINASPSLHKLKLKPGNGRNGDTEYGRIISPHWLQWWARTCTFLSSEFDHLIGFALGVLELGENLLRFDKI
ncbi:putative F-box/FBD/LRR-repeat protein At1g78840 [Cornus florida]|uniref:putative F-box/FBD/LRR-repeat protein At1g78840 n=1 Tax=Cornus florida TaxID=4283 RepID=UPI002897DD97|nr:putative F-box/FBD/LRR-repeat protein At1g78840 [Cornus florida]